MRYYKDDDGDIWVSDGADLAIVVTEDIPKQLGNASAKWATSVDDLLALPSPVVELIEKPASTDEISDGHHTFGELYEHRRALTAVLAASAASAGDSWRSKRHHPDDPSPMFDGSFIVGIELPTGQVLYHYKLEFWDDFAAVPEIEHAPKWDGAGPADTVARLLELARMVATA